MRKCITSMFLAMVLCIAALVPAALAEGIGETRVGFTVGGYDNFYPYGTAASGAGWSYDGNQTFTLNGISLTGTNKDIFQLCNPDRNFTFVAAAGSVNTLGSLETMYKMGSSKHITVTLSGAGTINCTRGLHFGTDDVVFSGPTANCESDFYCGKLTMNSGFLSTQYLTLGAGTALNGGGIEFKNDAGSSTGFRFQITYDADMHAHAMDQATGQAIASQFVDQYGEPLRYEVTDYGDYSVGYVYDSKGEYASYARFGAAPEPTVGDFADVKQSAWYADSVEWAVGQDITTGTSETTFSPDTTCTKAQIITFLWRAAGSPEADETYAIADVAASQYYYDAVMWAAENDMIAQDAAFGPNAPCTRQIAVEYMWKQAGSPDAADAGFSDVSSDAVNWAVEQGVTNGTSANTFSPASTCTRAEIVTFLYRAFA